MIYTLRIVFEVGGLEFIKGVKKYKKPNNKTPSLCNPTLCCPKIIVICNRQHFRVYNQEGGLEPVPHAILFTSIVLGEGGASAFRWTS